MITTPLKFVIFKDLDYVGTGAKGQNLNFIIPFSVGLPARDESFNWTIIGLPVVMQKCKVIIV